MPWSNRDSTKMEDNGAMNVVSVAGYTAISTNATTVIKTGSGVFYGLTCTAIGTLTTVTVYDNTAGSGQVLVPVSIVTTALGLVNIGLPSGMAARFVTGLTIVTAGTSPATLLAWWA